MAVGIAFEMRTYLAHTQGSYLIRYFAFVVGVAVAGVAFRLSSRTLRAPRLNCEWRHIYVWMALLVDPNVLAVIHQTIYLSTEIEQIKIRHISC